VVAGDKNQKNNKARKQKNIITPSFNKGGLGWILKIIL
jgi:hypothetical protein